MESYQNREMRECAERLVERVADLRKLYMKGQKTDEEKAAIRDISTLARRLKDGVCKDEAGCAYSDDELRDMHDIVSSY